jgi:hypothetical protein
MLNCTFDWIKAKRIDADLKNGEYVFVGKSIPTVRYVGTVGDFLTEQRDKEFQKILEVVSRNSVDVEVAVAKAVVKTLPLKETPKIEVKKRREPDANEIVFVALEGKSGAVLRRLLTIANA